MSMCIGDQLVLAITTPQDTLERHRALCDSLRPGDLVCWDMPDLPVGGMPPGACVYLGHHASIDTGNIDPHTGRYVVSRMAHVFSDFGGVLHHFRVIPVGLRLLSLGCDAQDPVIIADENG